MQLLAWQEPVSLHNYYLTVLATHLEGWVWPKQAHRQGYPPAAAELFHRALVATRGLTTDHSVVRQLVGLWNLQRV